MSILDNDQECKTFQLKYSINIEQFVSLIKIQSSTIVNSMILNTKFLKQQSYIKINKLLDCLIITSLKSNNIIQIDLMNLYSNNDEQVEINLDYQQKQLVLDENSYLIHIQTFNNFVFTLQLENDQQMHYIYEFDGNKYQLISKFLVQSEYTEFKVQKIQNQFIIIFYGLKRVMLQIIDNFHNYDDNYITFLQNQYFVEYPEILTGASVLNNGYILITTEKQIYLYQLQGTQLNFIHFQNSCYFCKSSTILIRDELLYVKLNYQNNKIMMGQVTINSNQTIKALQNNYEETHYTKCLKTVLQENDDMIYKFEYQVYLLQNQIINQMVEINKNILTKDQDEKYSDTCSKSSSSKASDDVQPFDIEIYDSDDDRLLDAAILSPVSILPQQQYKQLQLNEQQNNYILQLVTNSDNHLKLKLLKQQLYFNQITQLDVNQLLQQEHKDYGLNEQSFILFDSFFQQQFQFQLQGTLYYFYKIGQVYKLISLNNEFILKVSHIDQLNQLEGKQILFVKQVFFDQVLFLYIDGIDIKQLLLNVDQFSSELLTNIQLVYENYSQITNIYLFNSLLIIHCNTQIIFDIKTLKITTEKLNQQLIASLNESKIQINEKLSCLQYKSHIDQKTRLISLDCQQFNQFVILQNQDQIIFIFEDFILTLSEKTNQILNIKLQNKITKVINSDDKIYLVQQNQPYSQLQISDKISINNTNLQVQENIQILQLPFNMILCNNSMYDNQYQQQQVVAELELDKNYYKLHQIQLKQFQLSNENESVRFNVKFDQNSGLMLLENQLVYVNTIQVGNGWFIDENKHLQTSKFNLKLENLNQYCITSNLVNQQKFCVYDQQQNMLYLYQIDQNQQVNKLYQNKYCGVADTSIKQLILVENSNKDQYYVYFILSRNVIVMIIENCAQIKTNCINFNLYVSHVSQQPENQKILLFTKQKQCIVCNYQLDILQIKQLSEIVIQYKNKALTQCGVLIDFDFNQ